MKSDMMNNMRAMAARVEKKPLAIAIAVPLLVGGLSSLLTHRSMEAFHQLRQPPLTPPDWVVPVAWSVLYILMGVASYLVYTSDATLVFNFVWPLLFLRLGMRLAALLWLFILFGLIVLTASLFGRIRRAAGLCFVPYLLWTAFAGYLNAGVYWLNR